MADRIVDGPWEPEDIPAGDVLYLRVPGTQVTTLDGRVIPESIVFRNHGAGLDERGMSTDWARYSTPDETRGRTRRQPPSVYGVISLSVSAVRAIPLQRDKHTPIFNDSEDPANPNNRAHTDVLGPKSKDETGDRRLSTEIRNRFQEIAVWEIVPEAAVRTPPLRSTR